MKGLMTILSRHGRFYSALACGLAAIALAYLIGFDAPLLAGGDVFYLVFLTLCGVMIARLKKSDLKLRAKSEDEGMVVVFLITLATIGFFCDAVFTALNKQNDVEPLPLILAAIGAPLG